MSRGARIHMRVSVLVSRARIHERFGVLHVGRCNGFHEAGSVRPRRLSLVRLPPSPWLAMATEKNKGPGMATTGEIITMIINWKWLMALGAVIVTPISTVSGDQRTNTILGPASRDMPAVEGCRCTERGPQRSPPAGRVRWPWPFLWRKRTGLRGQRRS